MFGRREKKMKIVLLLVILNAIVASCVCPTELAEKIMGILGRYPRELHGVLIKTENKTLFALNDLLLFVPASNNKLLTTSAAYRKFGGNKRVDTVFQGNVDKNGVVKELCLRASGDPTISFLEWNQAISSMLKSNRVSSIQGQVLIDDSIYSGRVFCENWEVDDLNFDYGALPTATVVDENTFTFNVVGGSDVGEKGKIEFENSVNSDQQSSLHNLQQHFVGSFLSSRVC